MALPTFRVLSLCSGAGGLDLGLRLAVRNARTVCWVEWDAAAAGILARRMAEGALDDAPIWSDVRTFDGRRWRGAVDCVVAGFPCQPFSVSGRRRGVEDPRHLWPSIERIIGECEPGWVVLENVPGLLSTRTPDGGWAIAVVVEGLEGMGYRIATGLYTAAEVGAPHRRERLFIVADSNSTRRGEARERRGFDPGQEPQAGGGAVAYSGGERRQGREPARAAAGATGRGDGASLAGVDGRPARAGFPPGPGDHEQWAAILAERPDLAPATEPCVRRVVDGLAGGVDLTRTERLRILGNGVVPQQAARAIADLVGQLADA